MKRRTAISALGIASLTGGVFSSAMAQNADFPPKQLTILVPFPAGGVSDALARGVGQKLAESLKIPVVVDNRPGGAAQIAANAAKQAPADGATILIGDIGAFALNPSLIAKLSYDIQKDFTPLARLVQAPCLVVVPANSPFNTMADFLNAARNRIVNIASQSAGSGGHLFAELLTTQAQAKLNHVPYRGSAPALMDLVGGRVDVLFDPVITSGPFVKDGRLKALAYGADQRSPQFPQVPTLAELGLGGVNLTPWFGMVVKSGTPRPVVDKLGEEVLKAIRSPDLVKRFTDQGLDVSPLGPAQFSPYLDQEINRWGKVIRDAGIKLE